MCSKPQYITGLPPRMSKRPTPIMVISGRTGDEDVFKALDLGAVDFVAKPAPRATLELESIQQELIRKVHSLRQLRIEKVRDRITLAPPVVTESGPLASPPKVVAIGSSTGGPAALMQIFGTFLEAPPCAFLISQHMPKGFTKGFADRRDFGKYEMSRPRCSRRPRGSLFSMAKK